MVRTEGADKRTTARFLAYGVNGLVGRADGRGVLPHRRADRRRGRHRRRRRRARAEAARGGLRRPGRAHAWRSGRGSKLEVRVARAARRGARRYLDLLASLGIDPEAADRLRNAARAVDDLRYAGAATAPGPHSTRLRGSTADAASIGR